MAIMKGIREYGTNGKDGKNGISLGFSVCSVLSVCSVFSIRLGIALATVKCGATAALAALFFLSFCEFCGEFPLLVYAVRIAPGVPFSTTNEARVLIGSSGLVTAATMR
jgi:hypothetical protein